LYWILQTGRAGAGATARLSSHTSHKQLYIGGRGHAHLCSKKLHSSEANSRCTGATQEPAPSTPASNSTKRWQRRTPARAPGSACLAARRDVRQQAPTGRQQSAHDMQGKATGARKKSRAGAPVLAGTNEGDQTPTPAIKCKRLSTPAAHA
jgi:hypothetical protein